MIINAHNLVKKYHLETVLNNINLTINKGEIIGLAGPSGNGKTTLLRCLHGLEDIQQGNIQRFGSTGFIFQQFHLFSHMNVLDNILYAPLKIKKLHEEHILPKLDLLLEKMDLSHKKMAYPHQLSGGQKQRVAIIRALALSPDLLILDEPTSALDQTLTNELVKMIIELNAQGMTFIIASHEMSFLQSVATRVLYINKGEIIKDVPPTEFFNEVNQGEL